MAVPLMRGPLQEVREIRRDVVAKLDRFGLVGQPDLHALSESSGPVKREVQFIGVGCCKERLCHEPQRDVVEWVL